MLVLKVDGKRMELPVIVTSFSNDESARPPALLKTESTTEVLIGEFHKFQNTY